MKKHLPRMKPLTTLIIHFLGCFSIASCDMHAFNEDMVSGDGIGEDTVKGDFRKWIARSSVPILRSRGMTDEEIKAELLRDFALTEEQVDRILAAQ